MTSFSYDHPNYTVRRDDYGGQVTGLTAGARFRVSQAALLKAAHMVVVTPAGTAGATFTVRANGSVIATVTTGASSAGTTFTTTLNQTIADLTSVIDVVGAAANTAGVVDVVYEWYAKPTGSVT